MGAAEGAKPTPQEAQSELQSTETQQAIEQTWQKLKGIAADIYRKDPLIFNSGEHWDSVRRERVVRGEKFPFIFDNNDWKREHGARIDFDPDDNSGWENISFRWYENDGTQMDVSIGHFTDPVLLKGRIVPEYSIKFNKKLKPNSSTYETERLIGFRNKKRRERNLVDRQLQITSDTEPSLDDWNASEEKAIFDKITAELEKYNQTVPEPKRGLLGRLFRRGS